MRVHYNRYNKYTNIYVMYIHLHSNTMTIYIQHYTYNNSINSLSSYIIE